MKTMIKGILCRCAGILAAVTMANMFVPYVGKTYAYNDSFDTQLKTDIDSSALITKKFDLGGKGAASGYIGVSATDKYTASKGYGFQDTTLTKNVDAKGTGALADAVHFQGSDGQFMVDLPTGVYKIKVTAGNVESTTIVAEGISQVFFMTGNNAVDEFSIPVTDGRLNIHATAGVGSEFSISAIEIEQTSTGTTTKPTIWISGDNTAGKHYNDEDKVSHGWGEYLANYVNTDKYDIRDISATSMTAEQLDEFLFPTVEKYGKSGDILILAVGIEDYLKARAANTDAPDSSSYVTNLSDMVRRAKAKGMKVYIVKQHGEKSDIYKYPLPATKWFHAEAQQVAKNEGTGIIDLYRPFLELLLDNDRFDMKEYYSSYELYMNELGADTMAKMVSSQIFPKNTKQPTPTPIGTPTVIYQADPSGEAVSNPHKGFVMTAYTPMMINSTGGYIYGIGGSANNRAWDVVTIVSGSPHWNDLNPSEGVYNWKEIDDMLEACAQHGLTYGIRIMPYSSYLGKDFVPQWVYAKGAKKITAKSSEDSSKEVVFPKWDDPVYIQAHKAFVKALAEKYDGDPRVEFIDVRPFGDYGEWHNSFAENGDSYMPSESIQKDMLSYYASLFHKTLLAVPSSAYGEIYKYALSLGITKRHDGLICMPNIEWSLRPAYYANLPVVGENYWPYSKMKALTRKDDYSYVNWTPKHFRETIEISHLSIFALDQDSNCSYDFYKEQKSVIDEMCNRLGYNYTVTSAGLYGNKLAVTIKNTGLAPSYFNIDLCAEITDANGNKIANFGSPIRIEKGAFHDATEKTFIFEYSGEMTSDMTICLAMYDCDNPLIQGKDPTVRFDNKNNLPNKRLKLVATWTAPTPTPTKPATPIPTKKTTPAPTGKTTPVPTGKATPMPGKPTATPVPGKPTSTPIPGQPTATPVPGEPTPTRKPGDPTPTTVPGQPTTTPQPGQPTTKPGDPTPTTKPGQPTPNPGDPTPTPDPEKEPSIADFVERLYTIALNRASEPEGKAFWVKEIEDGNRTGGDCAYFFLIEAPEFKNRGLSDEDFVETLYKTFFDRDSEAAGKKFWVDQLKHKTMTRDQVIMGFIDSKEWCNVCATYGVKSGAPTAKAEIASKNAINFATRLYTCCLGREAEEGGLKYWSLALTNLEQTGCSAAKEFFTSAEFVNFKLKYDEYVRRLYTTFMGRDPEASEIAYWVGEIKAGRQTKDTVMAFFGQSEEFTNICKQYGIDRGMI
ncbi:MAG: DUF4214 domain-containing protein [Clostridiales bacterium]|nr:DUF4214 domain-containing protein [Clostridiales bacterium]